MIGIRQNYAIKALLIMFAVTLPAFAGPKFSRGTSASGVVAYQDDTDPNQFFYLPARVPLELGKTLQDFKVTYWGVGTKQLVKETGSPIAKSRVGAVVAGTAALDITDDQRKAIIAEIQKAFNIANPKLLPIAIKNVKVQPVIATQTLTFGNKDTDIIFPTNVAFGNNFNFLVGTGNSLFAQFAAAQSVPNMGIQANPSFAVNIVGDAEFVGDPWEANCTADLSQVWSKVRTSVSASVNWGWFHIGSASYDSIVQDLTRNNVIKCQFVEGSLDNEKYGRQVFEMVKHVFEEINKKAAAGDGFFRFEPNPEPPAGGGGGGGSSWWPWSVSINGSYSSAYFKQAISWSDNVKYTGRFLFPVPSSMVLAVNCTQDTQKLFIEIGNSEPCVTEDKSKALNDRLAAENRSKSAKVKELYDRLAHGEIDPDKFDRILAAYDQISFEEDLSTSPLTASVGSGATKHTLSIAPVAQHTLSDKDISAFVTAMLSSHPKGLVLFQKVVKNPTQATRKAQARKKQ